MLKTSVVKFLKTGFQKRKIFDATFRSEIPACAGMTEQTFLKTSFKNKFAFHK
jgi:hypothetical protein